MKTKKNKPETTWEALENFRAAWRKMFMYTFSFLEVPLMRLENALERRKWK